MSCSLPSRRTATAGRLSLRLLLLLLAAWAPMRLSGLTPPAAAAAAPSSQRLNQLKQQPTGTTCTLGITNSTTATISDNISSLRVPSPHLQASLSCSGPPLTIAASPHLAALLKQSATGVRWDLTGCGQLGCLLSICATSSAVFQGAIVSDIHDAGLTAAVCISGNSSIVFEGGTLSGISASQGALLVLGAARVSLHHTHVTNNTANSTLGAISMGGGLLLQEQGRVHISDSVFEGNRAVGQAAAMGAALAAQDSSRVFIAHSTLRDNAAVAADVVGYATGGAVYAEGAAVVEASDVMIVRNMANGSVVATAGAVCVMHNATVSLVNCVLHSNAARSPAVAVGGALAAFNSTVVSLTNTTLSSNVARGVYVLGAGGAVWAANEAAIHVVGGRVENNAVNGSLGGVGGGLTAFDNSTLHLRGTLVANNKALSGGPVFGGGIACFNTSTLYLEETTVTSNNANCSTASAGGGGLGALDRASIHVVRCNITHNWVKGSGSASGAAVYAQGAGPSVLVEDSTLESNSAAAYELTGGFAGGGAVGARGRAKLAFKGSSFLNNHVAGISATDGGAIYVAESVLAVVESCRFTGNTAAGIKGYLVPSLISCGGALAVQEQAVLLVNRSSFASNFVDGIETCGGGACAADKGTLHIVASHFVGNQAAGSSSCGGGVCGTSNGSLHLESTEFDGNVAVGMSIGGAACLVNSSRANILSCNFSNNMAGFQGGGVGIADGCRAAVSHCAFFNNSALNAEGGCGGGISCGFEAEKKEIADCRLDNSVFEGNTAMGHRGSGGGVYTANAAVNISSCVFSANKAQQGGGLGGSGVSWSISNTTFANHRVVGPGGAIFTYGALTADLLDTSIHHNRKASELQCAEQAGSEGGGLYASSSLGQPFKLSINATNITHNQAQTGGGIFLRSGETRIGAGTVISHNTASQQAGGVGWVGSCVSAQVCTSVLDIACGADVSSNTAAVAGGGLFVGEAFNTHLETSEDCVAVAVRNNTGAFGEADVFYVRSTCKPGQVSKGGWCDTCPPNMYGFDPHSKQCEVCPDNAFCPGGDVVLPNPGFWHSTNNATQIHACPNNAACSHTLNPLNAHAPINWQCATGYQGRVCGTCQTGYGMTQPFKCGACMPYEQAVALYAAALLCLVAFLSYSSNATWHDNLQPRVRPKVSDTIKTLVLYINYVLILSSIHVEWPNSLSYLFTAVAWLLSSCSGQVLSLDCVLPANARLPLPIQRQLVYLLLPLVVTAGVLLVFVLCWLLHAVLCCNRRRLRAFSAHVSVKIPTAVLVSLYLFFPSLIRIAWGMFACLKLDEWGLPPFAEYAIATAARGYWVQDMRQACYEGWHLHWALGLGLSCVLVFCVGVPAALLWWLNRNRNCLAQPEFQRHYGFLYADFRPARYWWEALVAARTVLLVCIAVFASVVGPYYGVVMMVVVFHLSVVMQLSFKPFLFLKLHRMQLAALGCLDLTACVALTFFKGDADNFSREVLIYKEAVGAVLLATHAAFVCWCLWVMLADLPMQQLCSWVRAARQRNMRMIRGLLCRLRRSSSSCCTSTCCACSWLASWCCHPQPMQTLPTGPVSPSSSGSVSIMSAHNHFDPVRKPRGLKGAAGGTIC